jgi:hypothetical protein
MLLFVIYFTDIIFFSTVTLKILYFIEVAHSFTWSGISA